MTSTALAAAQRAEARLATILPKLVDARRELARLQAQEATLLAEARDIAEDWAAGSDPGPVTAWPGVTRRGPP